VGFDYLTANSAPNGGGVHISPLLQPPDTWNMPIALVFGKTRVVPWLDLSVEKDVYLVVVYELDWSSWGCYKFMFYGFGSNSQKL
jgi:hypothetical protein